MRTARVLTVSPSMLCAGGMSAPGGYLVGWGVPGPGRCLLWGVYLVWGCTWSGGCLLWGVYLVLGGVCAGGCLLWGVSAPGGCLLPGGCTWSGGVCSWGVVCVCLLPGGCQVLPPVNRITDTCKNITLPQLRCGR